MLSLTANGTPYSASSVEALRSCSSQSLTVLQGTSEIQAGSAASPARS
jgi:hypothetical protein